MIELKYLSVLILIRQAHPKNAVYHYRYSLDEGFHFQSSVCNSCQEVLMMLIKINSIAILNIHSVEHCFNH